MLHNFISIFLLIFNYELFDSVVSFFATSWHQVVVQVFFLYPGKKSEMFFENVGRRASIIVGFMLEQQEALLRTLSVQSSIDSCATIILERNKKKRCLLHLCIQTARNHRGLICYCLRENGLQLLRRLGEGTSATRICVTGSRVADFSKKISLCEK